jgi:hypothetical protein
MFSSLPSMDTFFSNITIPYDCEFLVTRPSNEKQGAETSLSLIELYQDHPTRSLRKEPVAKWTSGSGLTWFARPLLTRRSDLHGVPIRAGLINDVSTSLYRFRYSHTATYECCLFCDISPCSLYVNRRFGRN